MKTKEECMELIKSCADTLRHRFGVRSLRLFGSVAREEQQPDSDVDVCVEMASMLYLLVELSMYLEELLGCRVDVVRMNRNMNAFLRKEIEKDGIFIL
ncbi:nucleotidyltransferase family protein [Parabacteroides sp.]|uniref:nucleotidyltransferase family protein n=1 Tax=Parabacteroides sp. TaxID=1869337 RepID=UPI0026E103C5|nr:nucleotidyltransferase domain-containing protein [Parabacteroides sp.]MDO5430046.1 nucleotidyltransferase domain-containing protein [Parabacteroides sp.]